MAQDVKISFIDTIGNCKTETKIELAVSDKTSLESLLEVITNCRSKKEISEELKVDNNEKD